MGRKPTFEELEQKVRELEKVKSSLTKENSSLKLGYERLEDACRLGKVGWWEFDAVTGEGMWTDEVARIHDIDPALPVSRDAGIEYYTESSRGKIIAAVKDIVEKGLSYELELELLSAKGNRKWVQTIGRPVFENGRVFRVVGILRDITESKLEEEKLKESEERFRSLIEWAPEGIFIQSDELFRYLNPAMVTMLGASKPEDLLGTPFLDRVEPQYHNVILARIRYQNETGQPAPPTIMEQEFIRLDGTKISVESTAVVIKHKGRDARMVFVRDITFQKNAEAEREELQSRLQQAQKLDSIGQLAGGVAHDYNNMLGVILGYTDMALEKIKSGEAIHSHLLKIKAAAERSENITRQLLAFARRQTIVPKFLDLNQMVDGMLKMLHRLIGENIDLIWLPKQDLGLVKMDATQVDQIIVNLCINARDAIIESGTITIETDMVVFDESYCKNHAECLPGKFVTLIVSDNGSGMDRDTVSKIFEPFFTTKGMGRGTGLGLATVYGIVKQNDGFINVYSEPDKGTSFKVYFPCNREHSIEDKECESGSFSMGRGEWILVVEDDAVFLELIKNMLADLGYNTLATCSPIEAIQLTESHCDRISLLITDVIMPEMTGREVALKVKKYCPEAKIIYTSGYTANVIAHQGVLEDGINFLQKPFSKLDLAVKMREVLDERG